VANNDSRPGARRLAIAIAGLSLVTACAGKSATLPNTTTAPPATTTSTSAAPAGYTVFTDAADHFRIATPTTWRQIDPASPGAAQLIQQMLKVNPKLSTLVGTGPADLASKGIKFLAVDVAAPQFLANVNLVTKPALGVVDSDLPQLADALRSEYQKIGAVVTSTATIPLAGHQALQVKLRLALKTLSGSTTTADETQDLIAANDLVYTITFAGSSPQFSTIESSISVS
jgi:hypothetical protein